MPSTTDSAEIEPDTSEKIPRSLSQQGYERAKLGLDPIHWRTFARLNGHNIVIFEGKHAENHLMRFEMTYSDNMGICMEVKTRMHREDMGHKIPTEEMLDPHLRIGAKLHAVENAVTSLLKVHPEEDLVGCKNGVNDNEDDGEMGEEMPSFDDRLAPLNSERDTETVDDNLYPEELFDDEDDLLF